MAEVGLLPFTRIDLQVSRAVLPRYRSRFSKREFTQPQLLAILCLMRYEDWTFREAEVCLSEDSELRQVLSLVSVPDFTTLDRFLERLDDQTIDQAVGETVRQLRGSLLQGRKRVRVAVDATGLTQGAVSTFFVRRMHHHGQKSLPWRHWLKWVLAANLNQRFLLSQIARRSPWNDCANLPAVVEAASEQTRIGLVLADVEFDSERNHTYIRQRLGAQSVIPAKRGKKYGACEEYVPKCGERFHNGSIGAGPDRKPVLLRETETLGSCRGPFSAHADASSPVARIQFHSIAFETSPPFRKDVIRARWLVEEYRVEVLRVLPTQPQLLSFAVHNAFLQAAFDCLDLPVFSGGSMFNLIVNPTWAITSDLRDRIGFRKVNCRKCCHPIRLVTCKDLFLSGQ